MQIRFQKARFGDPFWIRLGPKMTHKTAQERPKPCTKRSRERPKTAQGKGGPSGDPFGTHWGAILELLGQGEPSGTHFGPILDPFGTYWGPILDRFGTQWGLIEDQLPCLGSSLGLMLDSSGSAALAVRPLQ